jgi:hypothetical protein
MKIHRGILSSMRMMDELMKVQIEKVAEAASIEGLSGQHKRPFDWRYRTYHKPKTLIDPIRRLSRRALSP